jgi:hypothetical protein
MPLLTSAPIVAENVPFLLAKLLLDQVSSLMECEFPLEISKERARPLLLRYSERRKRYGTNK